jgi:hypothetical protein
MGYVTLGRAGLQVSQICLSFGAPRRCGNAWTLDEADSRPIIWRAL